jgi:hypothetical protein
MFSMSEMSLRFPCPLSTNMNEILFFVKITNSPLYYGSRRNTLSSASSLMASKAAWCSIFSCVSCTVYSVSCSFFLAVFPVLILLINERWNKIILKVPVSVFSSLCSVFFQRFYEPSNNDRCYIYNIQRTTNIK